MPVVGTRSVDDDRLRSLRNPVKSHWEFSLLMSILAMVSLVGCGIGQPEETRNGADTDLETETPTNPEVDTAIETDTSATGKDSESIETEDSEVYIDTSSGLDTETEEDECPDDPRKTTPGQCGCGKTDNDADGDGVANCLDVCPSDGNKTTLGQCGCGVPDPDSDGDGTADCIDLCPKDPEKTWPGICGCFEAETDVDGDGTPDCQDECPKDPTKTVPGVCGCGVTDETEDSDGDGIRDCDDDCPLDPEKIIPGICGCGAEDDDTDSDGDGTRDCVDDCPFDPEKTHPQVCGCNAPETDSDMDGALDCIDTCPADSEKTSAGACGCGVPDSDENENGVPDCNENTHEYVAGLKRNHRVDSNKDGVFESVVCKDLTYLWEEDSHLRLEARSFGFAYYHGETPCDQIGQYDRWLSVFEGFLVLFTADSAQTSHGVEFIADVNDGVRLVLMDPEGTAEICRMELWQDVPEYHSYHSTDGYAIDHGCETTLTAGVYYPMRLEVYHESDPEASNALFNRAYLDMFYRGVPTGGAIEFFRLSE